MTDTTEASEASELKKLESIKIPGASKRRRKNVAPDANTESEKQQLELDALTAQLENFKQDKELRKEYAGKVYKLVVGWLVAVGLLYVLTGFGTAYRFFSIPDNAITTLIGGTSLAIVGLFAVVARYLFSEKRIKD